MSAILPESINTENECDAAEAWGEEDALQDKGSAAAQYFVPGSPQWDAYEAGYKRGQQLLQIFSEYNPAREARTAIPQRLPTDNPGLWALRGYEDALLNRPIRSRLPPIDDPDHAHYHLGYTEGAARLKNILAAAPRRHTIPNS